MYLVQFLTVMEPESFYITGIGASAGGTSALQSFFKQVGDQPNTAFIIIQHLAIDQQGFAKDLLKNSTNLPITQVEEKTKLKVNHIYLIPPQFYLLLSGNYLELKPRDPNKIINDAIDVFFHSLADQAEEKAIGIILSGLGSDGAKGVQKIRERGGIIMVQSPESATFSSMPLEAIISDHPDVIDSVENIARDLLHFINHPFEISVRPESIDQAQTDSVQKIISLVNEYSGVNFRDYKINTILRRIDKRLKINYLKNTNEYLGFLAEKPGEIKVLYNDLLIGVTEFFRDMEAFETLKNKVIPAICEKEREYGTLRIWVPACSTGEEAYSVAIMLDDYIRTHHLTLDFKIFATDLDPKAIELARRGRFSKHIELQVPTPQLKTYFSEKGDFYMINNDIRKRLIFSTHNILSDPPFVRMDLITCRNLFIYLKEEVQKKVLYTFNYALTEEGFLMLGGHESQSDPNDLFEEVDARWRIYKNKKRFSNLNYDIIQNTAFSQNRYPDNPLPVRPTPPVIDQENEIFAEMLLEKYAPDCLLLTEENQVIYVTGKVENYLNFPKRKDNLLLFDMIGESTSLAFRNGLRKIKEEQRNVVLRGVEAITKEKVSVKVDIFFYSIFSSKTSTKYILVEIKSVDVKENDQEFIEVSSRESLKEIERLEAELKQVKKELYYNMVELETINEELQSSNEEMKSSNEEMQTTNEEMQSANEELKTVNLELKAKIEEITVLHDDVENLFFSTQIATLFLDRNLKIRKFTPALQQYFNIRESDIGRPIYHYTHNFGYSELEIEVEKVLQTLQPLEREIETNHGYALIRIIPYKTDDRRIEGIVLTFVDVSPLKKANLELKTMASSLKNRTAELEQLENYYKSLVENTPDIVARLDQEANILFVNNSLKSHLAIEAHTLIGKNLSGLKHSEFQEEIQVLSHQVNQALKGNKLVNYNQTFTLENYTKIYFITIIPEKSVVKGQKETLLLIAREITEIHSVESKIKEKNRILEDLNLQMDNFVHTVAHDLRAPLANLKLILELVADEENPVKRDLLLGKLNLAVVRIDDILNALIEIIDSQVKGLEMKQRVKFKTVIQKTMDQFKGILPVDSHIDINLEVKEVPYIKSFLYSIIRNLINNAIRYRRQDIPLIIRMETRKEGNYIIFSIEDNGRGMDFDAINNYLYKPFRQFDLIGEGIGIGLHIVKSMLDRTGGKIVVESEKGKRTKFYIYFKDEESEFIEDSW